MASLISDALKAELNGVLDDIHDTFKKEITVFVEQVQEVPSSSTYNPLYNRDSEGTLSAHTILTPHTICARVYYPDRALEQDGANLLHLPDSIGRVRIKVDAEGLDLIHRAEKIEVDNVLYTAGGDNHIEGPFGTNYHMVFLERIN